MPLLNILSSLILKGSDINIVMSKCPWLLKHECLIWWKVSFKYEIKSFGNFLSNPKGPVNKVPKSLSKLFLKIKLCYISLLPLVHEENSLWKLRLSSCRNTSPLLEEQSFFTAWGTAHFNWNQNVWKFHTIILLIMKLFNQNSEAFFYMTLNKNV